MSSMDQDTQFQVSVLSILSQSYTSNLETVIPLSTPIPKRTTSTKFKTSTIYETARSGISLSRDLLGHYDRTCQQITSAEGLLSIQSGSEGDLQTLKRIFDKQGEKTKLEVELLLNGSSGLTTKRPGDDASAGTDELWSRFAESKIRQEKDGAEQCGGKGWAVTAECMLKGVQRMVKCLPEDSE